jgi:hypothetical protein
MLREIKLTVCVRKNETFQQPVQIWRRKKVPFFYYAPCNCNGNLCGQLEPASRPGTDVMISKIFSPKNLAKNWHLFVQFIAMYFFPKFGS